MNVQVYVERKERRLRQSDVAKMLIMSEQSYRDRENGKRQFTIREGKRLAKYYGTTLDQLFQ